MFRSKSISRQHRKVHRQRRRHRDRLFGPGFFQRTIRKIEEYGKRLTVGLLGRLIAPQKNVSVPLDARSLQRILFIRNDAIGDMVLSTPFWRLLKQKYPHLQIGIVGSFRNLPIVSHDPDIDYRYECSAMTLREVLQTARATRKQKWDLVIPLIYNKKTKMAVLSKLFAPTAVSSMVLLRDDPAWRYEKLFSINILSNLNFFDGPILELMRIHLERTIDITVSDDEWRLSLRPNEAIVNSITPKIEAHLKNDSTSAYFYFNIDAKNAFKEFGYQNSLELSERLLQLYPDHSIVWTVSPISFSQAEEFLKEHPIHRLHLQPTSSIHEVIGIVRGASIVISPDTSVIHIASAERRPVVGLYPFFHEWQPYKVPNVVLVPVYGQPVATIPVSQVVSAVEELMRVVQSSVTTASVPARDWIA